MSEVSRAKNLNSLQPAQSTTRKASSSDQIDDTYLAPKSSTLLLWLDMLTTIIYSFPYSATSQFSLGLNEKIYALAHIFSLYRPLKSE